MKKFDAIAFDLDSTLVTIEGLDWLAKQKGLENQVLQITEDSMNGSLPVEMAFEKKMALIAPSYDDLVNLGKMYLKSLVPGAKETVHTLHVLGKEVWIVTGNFNPAPQIVANELNIPLSRVKCNTLRFTYDLRYGAYDKSHPLIRNGGKATMVKSYIKQNGKNVAFVGDAVTDLETQPFIDRFIGFGGVVIRPKVQLEANVFTKAKNLTSILEFILTDEEKKMSLY